MCAPGPPAFRGVRILGAVLKDLAEDRLATSVPIGLPPEWWSQVANKFIPTLFAGVLNGAVMLRVLDAFFCGGGLRSLVAASLRLVECYFDEGIDEASKISLRDNGCSMDSPDAPQILWAIFPYTRDFSDADMLISGAYGSRGGKKAVELAPDELDRRVHQERSRLVRSWQKQPPAQESQEEAHAREQRDREMYAGWTRESGGVSVAELSSLHREYLKLPPSREDGMDISQWVVVIGKAVGPASRWAKCDAVRLFHVCDVDGVGAVSFPQAVQCISTLLTGQEDELLELVFKCYEHRRALQLRSGTGALEADDIDSFALTLFKAANLDDLDSMPLPEEVHSATLDEIVLSKRLSGLFWAGNAHGSAPSVTRDVFVSRLKGDSVVRSILRSPMVHDRRIQNAFQQHGRNGVFSAVYGGVGSVGTSLVSLPRDAFCSVGGVPRGTAAAFASSEDAPDSSFHHEGEREGFQNGRGRVPGARSCSEAGCRQQ